MNAQEIMQALAAPFPPDFISWRVGSVTQDGTKGMALAYIDARDAMNRLDEVLGPNWQCRYMELSGGKTICEIGLKIDGEWVWRADGAGDTNHEAEKGALSDSFKRAAVKWGVGRYLYDLKSPWVKVKKLGKTAVIDQEEMQRLEAVAREAFKRLAGKPAPAPTRPQQEPAPEAPQEPAGAKVSPPAPAPAPQSRTRTQRPQPSEEERLHAGTPLRGRAVSETPEDRRPPEDAPAPAAKPAAEGPAQEKPLPAHVPAKGEALARSRAAAAWKPKVIPWPKDDLAYDDGEWDKWTDALTAEIANAPSRDAAEKFATLHVPGLKAGSKVLGSNLMNWIAGEVTRLKGPRPEATP